METNPPGAGDRVLSAIAYLGPLVIVPLLTRPALRFVRYHTRQALYLFGVAVILVAATFGLLYLFGPAALDVGVVFQVFAVLILMEIVAYVALIVFFAFQASRGQMPMLPVLGDLAGEV